jgi:hypothetical protein
MELLTWEKCHWAAKRLSASCFKFVKQKSSAPISFDRSIELKIGWFADCAYLNSPNCPFNVEFDCSLVWAASKLTI